MKFIAFISIVVSALIIPGLILKVKSIFSGRKGPGLVQPLKDIFILLNKGSVYSSTSGIIFRIAPVVNLSTILVAALFIPFSNYGSLLSFNGDFVYFLYALALGRFFMIIAALDTGSSFEGMGASREAFFSLLAEPAFFVIISAFAIITGNTSFSEIFTGFSVSGDHNILIFALTGAYVLFQISLVETCRVPVDDPKTHLELTMIHEVMILDYSGFDKALIHIGTYFKQGLFSLLIFNCVSAFKSTFLMKISIFLAVLIAYTLIIGMIESFRARNKMNRNPKYILAISAVSWIALVMIIILKK